MSLQGKGSGSRPGLLIMNYASVLLECGNDGRPWDLT